MESKITSTNNSNSKSTQYNIGEGRGGRGRWGQSPPTSMNGVNLLFVLTSLSTRDQHFVNRELLWVLTASNCKSIYTTYLKICF